MIKFIETDVLVIGCGIAGAVAAIELAESGLNVVLATRSKDLLESNTKYAQGGIIYKGDNDSPKNLEDDIKRAGAYLSNPKAVSILAKEGPDLVKKILIEKIDTKFDVENGKISLALEGGHSLPRISHVADSTGYAIETQLIKFIKESKRIKILNNTTAVDLLTPSHHSINKLRIYEPLSCIGAYLLNQETGEIFRSLARKTVLATGGLGQIYLLTTNPSGARGDGIAMANRAGARVVNLEYIQFHPTAFKKENAPPILITEAARGEGAKLVHQNGKPFMEKYDEKWRDLAPRDIVARSIYNEMLTYNLNQVFLDFRNYMPKEKILKHFPNIYSSCLSYGIDITHDLVPVAPAAHYSCGGVWVNEWGETTIKNLFAVGEVSCTGLHGANRLASTSLLEGLVWAKRAAGRIKKTIRARSLSKTREIPEWLNQEKEIADPVLIDQDMNTIRRTMWNYVGLIRTAPRLQRAIRDLAHLENEVLSFYNNVKVTDQILGLRNAVRTAILVATAAWENKQSIGCHYRE